KLPNSQDGATASNPLQLQPAYLVVGATGQYAATWTYNKPAAPWAAAIVTYKIVFPTISSINLADSDHVDQNTNVHFKVTFSEPVFGFDAEDLALATTGASCSGTSIGTVDTSDNKVYTVSVNTGTGCATV